MRAGNKAVAAVLLSLPLLERVAIIVAHPGAVQGVDSWFLLGDAARGGGPATSGWPLAQAFTRALYLMAGVHSWIIGAILDYTAVLAVYSVLRLSGLTRLSASLIAAAAGSVPGTVAFGVQFARENIVRPALYMLPAYAIPAALVAALAGLLHHLLPSSLGASMASSSLIAWLRGEQRRLAPALGGTAAAVLATAWTLSQTPGGVERLTAHNISVSSLALLASAGLALGVVLATLDPGAGSFRRVITALLGAMASVAGAASLAKAGVGVVEAIVYSAPAVLVALALGRRPRGLRGFYALSAYMLLGILAAASTLPTSYTLGAIGRLSSVLVVLAIAGFADPDGKVGRAALTSIIVLGLASSTMLALDHTVLNSNITYNAYDAAPASYLSSTGWERTVIVDYTGSGPAYYYGLPHRVSCNPRDYNSGNLIIILDDMEKVGCRLIGGRIRETPPTRGFMIVYSNGHSMIVVSQPHGGG